MTPASRSGGSDRRIEQLYSITRHLLTFNDVESTFSEILKVASTGLPFRSAVLAIVQESRTRVLVWPAQGVGPESVRRAEEHAWRVHEYLTAAVDGEGRVASELVQDVLPPLPNGSEAGRRARDYVVLPLVVERRGTFGVVQMEGVDALVEDDVAFINVIANQLAVALDRDFAWHHEIALRERAEALERSAQAARAEAEAAHERAVLLSEVSARLAASLDPAVTLPHVAALMVARLADYASLMVVTDGNPLRFAAGERGAASAAARIERRLLDGDDAVVCLFGVGETRCPPEERAALSAEGVTDVVGVAIRLHGEIIGALVVMTLRSDRRLGMADLTLAHDVADRLATAVDSARLHAEALAAVRARDELIGMVSHDLKNPLSAVLLNAAQLLKKPAAGEERRVQGRRRLEGIKRAGERMDQLIRNLLDVTTAEAGRLTVRRRATALGPVIAETLQGLEALATDKDIHVLTEIPVDLPAVWAEGSRVQQVLANLIGNAIKFTPVGGEVTVRCEPLEGELLVAIIDTGPGIPPEDVPHLFDRFWRAARTTELGTGLGLSIARNLVLAHGGRIWVHSQVGAGTTFCFTLPFARPEALPEALATSTH